MHLFLVAVLALLVTTAQLGTCARGENSGSNVDEVLIFGLGSSDLKVGRKGNCYSVTLSQTKFRTGSFHRVQ